MTERLGTLEELPSDYRAALGALHLAPLWPAMRVLLPHHRPQSPTVPHRWAYRALRPLLLEAGRLTPVEKAERRVLVLCDPGREGALQATATIYAGLQLLLPGERAANHRHTPSAARVVVEGRGGYTTVEGEKLPMAEGDLILTPGGEWHEHGHEGEEPVVWLDALDLPLFVALDASYAEPGALQRPLNRVDASESDYLAAGLVPHRSPAQPQRGRYPQRRFPWARTEAALRQRAAARGEGHALLDYVNPETGEDVLPTLGFTAIHVAAGQSLRLPVSSVSGIFHVIRGEGESEIAGRRFAWEDKDTLSAPVFAPVTHHAARDAFLIWIHDRPLQERLGFYRVIEEAGR